jgi:hypothetical protein
MIMKQSKTKPELEHLLLETLRPIAGNDLQRVEVTPADPALYGANWAATSIDRSTNMSASENALLEAVTLRQGKYDVAW